VKQVLQPIIYALLLVLGIQFGFKFYEIFHKENATGKGAVNSLTTIGTVNEIMHIIDAKYVDPIDHADLREKMIDHTLQELDPHSDFIPISELQEVNESLDGKFEGIGIEFSILKDTILVVTPISTGPSESVGILPGDKIVLVDDSLVAGPELTNEHVMELLRGEKGTKVKLGIARGSMDGLLDFTVTRDEIPLNSVDVAYMMDKETGYIKINRFSSTTYNEFGTKMLGLIDKGMTKLVLDLRGNPGGFLDAAYRIADELIGGKEILVYTKGKNYQTRKYISKVKGIFERGNLAVLIDEGSASASEILAGAVQDLDRGIVVGRRSFGKGLVQEQLELSDGSALRIVVARYHTPSGRCIQKPYDKGDPDYFYELDERLANGELYSEDSIANVDSLKYYTRMGRIVYGGGGISPDVFVPLDTTKTMAFYRLRSQVPEFVYGYFSNNQDRFISYKDKDVSEGLNLDGDIYMQFKDFCRNKEVKAADVDFSENRLELDTYIKAYVARQVWGNNGFYPTINKIDEGISTCYNALQDDAQLAKYLTIK